jgi:hypothetical protein
MKAVWSQIADFLRKKPVWFVVAAWLLLVPTIFTRFALEVGAIDVPGPQHEWANYDQAVIVLLYYSFPLALLAALTWSIALGKGLRTIASASVVVIWLGLVSGGTLWLASIERGPQQYLRYAGQQQFFVPWQYNPRGSDSPSRSGFYVFLCLGSLLGIYDSPCHSAKQLTILPAETGFDSWEERIWQFRQNGMTHAGVRDGYQVYVDTLQAQGARRELTTFYFRRTDSEGKLRCQVICKSGPCQRQILIGRYILDYRVSESTFVDWNGLEQKLAAPETTFAEWDVIDKKLAALVDTWAVP